MSRARGCTGATQLNKGVQLSVEEKKQLEQMRRKQAELQQKLDEVERKAKLNQAELERLRDMLTGSVALGT